MTPPNRIKFPLTVPTLSQCQTDMDAGNVFNVSDNRECLTSYGHHHLYPLVHWSKFHYLDTFAMHFMINIMQIDHSRIPAWNTTSLSFLHRMDDKSIVSGLLLHILICRNIYFTVFHQWSQHCNHLGVQSAPYLPCSFPPPLHAFLTSETKFYWWQIPRSEKIWDSHRKMAVLSATCIKFVLDGFQLGDHRNVYHTS